jgi:hypothetical protein
MSVPVTLPVSNRLVLYWGGRFGARSFELNDSKVR